MKEFGRSTAHSEWLNNRLAIDLKSGLEELTGNSLPDEYGITDLKVRFNQDEVTGQQRREITRTMNVLARRGFETIGDLRKYQGDFEDLLEIGTATSDFIKGLLSD